MIRYGINGFGRIGRLALRSTLKNQARGQIVAVNNPGHSLDHMVYLLKYDSAHRTIDANVSHDGKNLIVNHNVIKVFNETDPSKIQWSEAKVDTLLECTGKFLTAEKTQTHLKQGV